MNIRLTTNNMAFNKSRALAPGVPESPVVRQNEESYRILFGRSQIQDIRAGTEIDQDLISNFGDNNFPRTISDFRRQFNSDESSNIRLMSFMNLVLARPRGEIARNLNQSVIDTWRVLANRYCVGPLNGLIPERSPLDGID